MTQMQQHLSLIHKYTPDTAFIGLTSIAQQRVSNTWFPATDQVALISTALKVGNKANVYVRLTPVQKPPLHGRGTEQDAIGASVLWVDYDAYAHQEEAIQTLLALAMPPTMIVNSGLGVHCYWLLDQFCTDLEMIKACNIGLMHQLNDQSLTDRYADSCFDLARILRLSQTYNIKTENQFECTIVHYDETHIYNITDFNPAVLDDLPTVEVWDTEPLSPDFIDTIRERDKRLYARITDEIRARKADAPITPDGHINRSENDFFIVLRLLSLGFTVGVAMTVLMQTQWLAGSKYHETRRYDYVTSTANAAYRHFIANNDRYFIQKQFQTRVLGQELNTQASFIYTAEKLWRYDSGVYKPDGVDWLRAKVLEKLGKRWTKHHVDEVVTWVTDQSKIPIEQCNQHNGLINCLNGMLDYTNNVLLPHDPKYLSLAQIPVIYDPDIDCSQLDTFFQQILPLDTIDVFWEYIGSIFIRDHYWPKAFLSIIGEADCGKSKILEWTIKFLGANNVSTKTFQSLADNRFASAYLFGALANIYDDLPASEAHDVGFIKALTGDTTAIDGERKFADSFSFKNNARLIFTANDYIRVKSPDAAYFQRILVIRCSNIFTKETADLAIVDKLSTTNNLSAGLLRAVAGLTRVLAQNGFSFSGSIADENREYRTAADSVQGFLSLCEFDKSFALTKEQLWDHYKMFCANANRGLISEDAFFKRVKANLERFNMHESYDLVNSGTGERRWRYHGRKPVGTVYAILTKS